MATEAQVRALRWMLDRGKEELRGGDFVEYYAAAAGSLHATTNRRHAWRRTGGSVLARMERDGLVARVRIEWGTTIYVVTPAGREAAAA